MRCAWLLVLLATLIPGAARAERDASYAISIGAWDAFQNGRSAETGAEYRLTSWPLFPSDTRYRLVPAIGMLLTSSQVTYLYSGLRFEIPLDHERFFFVPHTAAGYYRGNALGDLGGPLEFRSGLEVAYAFHNRARLRLTFFHVSTANIYHRNPGAETLAVTMQFFTLEKSAQPEADK